MKSKTPLLVLALAIGGFAAWPQIKAQLADAVKPDLFTPIAPFTPPVNPTPNKPAPDPQPKPKPRPKQPDPQPCPGPGPCPGPRVSEESITLPTSIPGPRRAGDVVAAAYGPKPHTAVGQNIKLQGQWRGPVNFVVGGPSLDGVEVACDLPTKQHLKNTGGSDGAGLCVFTSIDMSADWANDPVLVGFRDWMRQYPGGGYPEKVASMISKLAKEKNLPEPQYRQITTGDVEFLKAGLANRWMMCVTYSGEDGVYYRQKVAHMVCLVAYDEAADRAGILDNNYPGQILWMTCAEFKKRWDGWAFALVRPGPPPVPTNQRTSPMMPAAPPPPAIVRAADFDWRTSDHDDWWLAQDGKFIGMYRRSRDSYFQLAGNQWDLTPGQVPPAPVPRELWPAAGVRPANFGVMTDRIARGVYEVNGRPVARDAFYSSLRTAPDLPDTRGLYWLSINGGTAEERQAVLKDLESHPALATCRQYVQWQAYPAGAWPLEVGLVANGRPTIVLMDKEQNGKAVELDRLDSYPGAEQFAAWLCESLRIPDPNYNPDAFRSRRGPQDGDLWWLVAGLGGLFLLLIVVRKR